MQKLISTLTIFLFISCISYSQKEDNVWIFGAASENQYDWGYYWGNTVLDFSEVDPKVYYDSLITMDSGGAFSILSNADGALQLYTNGQQIHDHTHQHIVSGDTIAYSSFWDHWVIKNFYPNGDDWMLGLPAPQIIQLLPLNDSLTIALYDLVYHNGTKFLPKSLNYSIIKKSENGTYDVTIKDAIIKEDEYLFSQINGCRHANGRDWLIIKQLYDRSRFDVFYISPDTIALINSIQRPSQMNPSGGVSQVAFSPHGTYYATSESYFTIDSQTGFADSSFTELTLYNFDRCNGNLSYIDRDTFHLEAILSSLSFAPNGQYLYAASARHIYQYDITTENWKSTRKTVATYDGFEWEYGDSGSFISTVFGQMVNGPDGRIYNVPPGDNRYLHTIEYPNEEGEDANVVQRKINLPTSNFRSSPNLPHFRMGPLDGSPCDTLGIDNDPIALFRTTVDTNDYRNIRFTDLSYFRPENWSWTFGDGTSYEGKKPYYHQYAEDGVYEVCLTVSNENDSDIYCKTLYIGVTSIKEDEPNTNKFVSVFPNPVEEELQFTISDYFPRDGKLHILNNQGQSILSFKANHGWNNYDISSLSAGAYFYIFKDGNTNIETGSIIKL